MGVDCQLTLPGRARVRDVATVAGILLGCEKDRQRLGRSAAFWSCEAHGVVVIPAGESLPECCAIIINAPDQQRRLLYHFEWSRGTNGTAERGMLLRSRAENIALFRGLADVFGGIVTYADNADTDEDYVVPENPLIGAIDGDEWSDWQACMYAVEPLTKADIEACEPFAAYKKDE